MNFFNAPETLEKLMHHLPPQSVRLYSKDNEDLFKPGGVAFHVKAYLLKSSQGEGTLIIGSSNLTNSGIGKNIEWNAAISIREAGENQNAVEKAGQTFEDYWTNSSVTLDIPLIKHYKSIHNTFKQERAQVPESNRGPQAATITPSPAQKEALERLKKLMDVGESRAAVIAPTGFGKTYLSAFFSRASRSERTLFLVHRETIINGAKSAFTKVLGNNCTYSVIGGSGGKPILNNTGDRELVVFAMVQSLSENGYLETFPPDFFDTIIIDEFHHAIAGTYERVLTHFTPRFLLGMTATPERMDGRDVLEICHQNVAYEMRLFEAIEAEILPPFQYFAIEDPTDYSAVKWKGRGGYDLAELNQALSTDTRADLICQNLDRFIPSFGKIKAFAFCSTVIHAAWMAEAFITRGYSAIALSGNDPQDKRMKEMARLADEHESLQIICSVDIFSEGVDIPELTHILMLRPTQSITVFLQQLGRGLRKHPRKEYLIVLDFIGNYRNNFIVPLIFRRTRSRNENELSLKSLLQKKLPAGCSVDASTKVVRIWEDELKKTIQRKSLKEQFGFYYQLLKSDQKEEAPLWLMDFFHHPLCPNPGKFLKKSGFPNYLRALNYVDALGAEELSWLDTPGEDLLEHLESELHPTKAYKMVVLKSLLNLPHDDYTWKIDEIAGQFLGQYLRNPVLLEDYDDLKKYSRTGTPQDFPLNRVISHIKKNPLTYLSNSEDKPFLLQDTVFSLREPFRKYWTADTFRKHMTDRVNYALASYLARRQPGKSQFLS